MSLFAAGASANIGQPLFAAGAGSTVAHIAATPATAAEAEAIDLTASPERHRSRSRERKKGHRRDAASTSEKEEKRKKKEKKKKKRHRSRSSSSRSDASREKVSTTDKRASRKEKKHKRTKAQPVDEAQAERKEPTGMSDGSSDEEDEAEELDRALAAAAAGRHRGYSSPDDLDSFDPWSRSPSSKLAAQAIDRAKILAIEQRLKDAGSRQSCFGQPAWRKDSDTLDESAASAATMARQSYALDTRGDLNQLVYESIYRMDIPLYHAAGGSRVLLGVDLVGLTSSFASVVRVNRSSWLVGDAGQMRMRGRRDASDTTTRSGREASAIGM